MTRRWWTYRRISDRARLALAVALHVVAERLADAACRVAPDWERGA